MRIGGSRLHPTVLYPSISVKTRSRVLLSPVAKEVIWLNGYIMLVILEVSRSLKSPHIMILADLYFLMFLDTVDMND